MNDAAERAYEHARALPPGDRAAYLDAACRGDSASRAEIESLLERANDAEAFFERLADVIRSPALSFDDDAPSDSRSSPEPTLATGETIGHYRILSWIGRGGMGTVYRARDERLDREVALKFLPPQLLRNPVAVQRFRAEARAAAALEHPNVCTVHEIGETGDGHPFIAMAFCDGETLKERLARGPLPPLEAAQVGAQIVRGIAAAHARGIVHRDVKPGNVVLTTNGTVKLVDFGLAKVAGASLTAPGATLGTMAYMSPEQARGDAVDHRADLWSIGVVLYEMLAGVRPFRARNDRAVLHAILHDAPPTLTTLRPEMPVAFQALVDRLLRKSPGERYGSANAVLADLEAVLASRETSVEPSARTGALARRRATGIAALALAVLLGAAGIFSRLRPTDAPRERSVAILPFVDMSANGDDEHFSDGITEEIIARLSSTSSLKVISRTSAMRYKGTSKPLREIAAELGVAHVLEGSVRHDSGRVRVTVQLVDAATDYQLWSQRYDRRLADIPAVQGDIAREVGRALAVELNVASTGSERGTRDPEAYELYRRGRFLWGKRTKAAHEQAIAYFTRAIALDSTYAEPYSGLADAYLSGHQFRLSGIPETEVMTRVRWAAERALSLDERSAEAHASYAIAMWWNRDWPGAERELRRSIELNPGLSIARNWYAMLLSGMGRHEEAVEQNRRGVESDPFSLMVQLNFGYVLLNGRELDRAAERFRLALEIDDSWSFALTGLAMTYSRQGKHEAAIREASLAVERAPRSTPFISGDLLANLAYVHANAGKREEAERLLERAKRSDPEPFTVARAYVALGERDSAFVWLERSSWLWPHRANRSDAALDPIRGDPRFARLSARVEREMRLR